MKIKLDENMPADLAAMLREEGHDVADVVEEGLGGADDPPVLKAATDEQRILITFDLDFADIRHYPPGSHGGIVVSLARSALESIRRSCPSRADAIESGNAGTGPRHRG